MKVANLVLKIAALILAIGAAACCVVAFWDQIVGAVGAVANKAKEKRGYVDDYIIPDEDYSDWDE